jgi:diguanylate cyclase (GGDEF)-like protein/PAS domain S-box-containing protein
VAAVVQLYEQAIAPLAAVDADGRIVVASPGFARELDCERHALEGVVWTDLLGAAGQEAAATVRAARRESGFWSAEVRWRTPAGTAVRLQVSPALYAGPEGRFDLHLRLIDAEPTGEPEPGGDVPTLEPGTLFGAAALDADLVVRAVDAGATSLLGTDAVGRRWFDLLHPEDAPAELDRAAACVRAGGRGWAAVLRLAPDPADDAPPRARWAQVEVSVDEPTGQTPGQATGEPAYRARLALVDHWIAQRDDLLDALARARALHDEIPVALVELSTDGRIATANPALAELVGGDARGRWVAEFIPPDDLVRVFETVATALAGRRDFVTEFRVARRDGTHRWVRGAGRSRVSPEGEWVSLAGAWIDITDEVATRQASERFAELLETIDDLVAITDGEGTLVYLNRAGRALLGSEPGEAVHTDRLVAKLLGDSREQLIAELIADLEERGSWSGEVRLSTDDGPRDLSVLVVTHRSSVDGARYSVLLTRDISPLKEAERVLREQATHDLLTGLGNRSLLLAELSRCVTARPGERGGHLGVLFVDLDRFKPVNDRYGHTAGDHVLALTARRLEEAVREGDLAARFGGDEFVVLCPGVAGIAEAQRVADRIIEALSQPMVLPDGTPILIGASIGVALSVAGDSPEDVLRRADDALHAAKAEGRGRVALATAPPLA